MVRSMNKTRITKMTEAEVNEAIAKWEREKSYSGRAYAVDTIEGFYKAIGNKDLYEHFATEFNKFENDKIKLDALVLDVIITAGYDYIYIAASQDDLKHYRFAFQQFFGRGYTESDDREAIEKSIVTKMAYKQKFICPACNGKLDLSIPNGPLKVVADHCTPVSQIGSDEKIIKKLYGKNAISIVAMHQQCNCIKGTKHYLFGYIEHLK